MQLLISAHFSNSPKRIKPTLIQPKRSDKLGIFQKKKNGLRPLVKFMRKTHSYSKSQIFLEKSRTLATTCSTIWLIRIQSVRKIQQSKIISSTQWIQIQFQMNKQTWRLTQLLLWQARNGRDLKKYKLSSKRLIRLMNILIKRSLQKFLKLAL